jgi:DNA (cytosine-5)-methyltransferase 1
MNYYNEFDPFASEWLRELIKEGLIPDGEVDDRSITEVEANDLKGFTQCHFFAGIGGWSYALELAGWDSARPVWTGSPPCQPFSVAGNNKGKSDERHLAPVFTELVAKCQPSVIFGEQVSSAIRTGWFDDLQTDLEKEGYATAMVVLPACSVGAPHKRERLFFVSHSNSIDGRSKQESKQPERGQWWKSSGYSSVLFRDGKHRVVPTEPTLFPLADGVPNRVGLLRGAGNAIVPQVAAEVIKAYMDYASQES